MTHNAGCDLATHTRRNHILNGDATGGGHKFGAGRGKPEFPSHWSDDDIMEYVSDVATDPSLSWQRQSGRPGSKFTRRGDPVRFKVEGTRDGIDIGVIVEPDGVGIVTGFPAVP